MKLLILTDKRITYDLKPDVDKALKYLVENNAPFNLEYKDVTFTLPELYVKAQEYKKWDCIIYFFNSDIENFHYCDTVSYSKDVSVVRIPVGNAELSVPNWLWVNIAHELIHCLGFNLEHKHGIITNIHTEMDKYDDNLNPYSKTGNFSRAWTILKPHLSKIYPNYLPLKNYVEIIRNPRTKYQTEGTLTAYKNGMTFTCKTLELSWQNNKQSISSIPKGQYEVKWTFSPKFMRYTYEVLKVPSRSGIRIHKGNYAFKKGGKPDIEGCILLGTKYQDVNKDGVVDIIESTITVEAFEKFMKKENFTLIIK